MQSPVYISQRGSFADQTKSPLLHPALSTSLSRSFGMNSPFSLNAMSSSLTQMSSSPGFSSMGMSLGRSFEERPKLEAQFFRNFSCCGLDLQDLHGLLEHFEECHVAFEGDDNHTEVGMDGINDNGSDGTISGPPSPRLAQGGLNRNVFELKKSALGAFDSPGPTAAELHPDSGMELDMDMDDEDSSQSQPSSSQGFNGQMSAFENTLPLHGKKFATAMNARPLGGQGLQLNGLMGLDALAAARTAGGIAPNQTGYQTPDASVPGTPVMEDVAGAGVDGLFSVPAGMPNASQDQSALGLPPSLLFPTSPADSPPADGASQQGSPNPPTPVSLSLNFGALNSEPKDAPTPPRLNLLNLGPNNPLSQMPTALHPLGTGIQISPSGRPYTPPSEKPFKCSVPGCDKSYKQQNGLKYHRLHGHCNQNAVGKDGEDSSEGKPYVCHVTSCGKRYKNMNGLRYHYQHSGAHGALGLQMLAQSCHPPPQFPPGHKRKAPGLPGTPTASLPQSRATSPAGSLNSLGSVSRQSSPGGLGGGGLNFGSALQMGGVGAAPAALAFGRLNG